jgi:hypothetical protein
MGGQTGSIWFRIGTGGGVLVNTVMNLWVPYKAGNFLSSLGSVSFSGLCSV